MGCMIMICCAIKAAGLRTTFFPLACTLWRSSKVGKLCWTCHVTLGRKISTAITPPVQIHGLKNSCEQHANDDCKPKEQRGMLVHQSQTSNHAEPDPQPRVPCLNDS